ncbi:hypothetical protein K474DRAFT_1680786 [Panus rudis PR-1116 ss-1]|nr:hypothetical protein K474DRAFT_1680786 [Panus rudis PR-1116 ss-1]
MTSSSPMWLDVTLCYGSKVGIREPARKFRAELEVEMEEAEVTVVTEFTFEDELVVFPFSVVTLKSTTFGTILVAVLANAIFGIQPQKVGDIVVVSGVSGGAGLAWDEFSNGNETAVNRGLTGDGIVQSDEVVVGRTAFIPEATLKPLEMECSLS